MCTDFMIRVDGNPVVNGRSMEFGLPLKSKLFFRAPGHAYGPTPGTGEFRHSWTGQYGFVGLDVFDLPLPVDGLNTAGLSTGTLWLPGSAYQKVDDPAKGLTVDRFCEWVLSSFATCAEVRQALDNRVVEVGAPVFLKELLPVHFPIHDATGDSIVVEFIDGAPRIHDNPVGVLTNDPPFPWHLQNLRNYTDLDPWDREKTEFDGFEVEQTGHGTGMMHLPGDSTPPSRFVRAAAMTTFAEPAKTHDEAVALAFHVLNTVDIPTGTSRSRKGVVEENDRTQWVAVKDLARGIYYTRFYDSPQAYAVDLDRVDLHALDGKQVAVPASPIAIDLTKSLADNAVAAAPLDA
ncbi:MAG: linear amide C-N hydrolase [Azospirillaceae bacterium]